MRKPIMTLVRGLPGSGKSTWASKLGIFHIEQDMFRVRGGQYMFNWKDGVMPHHSLSGISGFLMTHGVDLVISECFVTLEEIQFFTCRADACKYDVRVVKMLGDYGSIHEISEQVIDIMKAQWEDYPGEEEIP